MATQYETDVVVVGSFEKEKKLVGAVRDIDRILAGRITAAIKRYDFSGKKGESILIPSHGIPSHTVLLLGLGQRRNWDASVLRELAASTAKRTGQERAKRIAFAVEPFGGSRAIERSAAAITEGVLLGTYKFDRYHGKETKVEVEKRLITTVAVLVGSDAQKRQATAGIISGQRSAAMTCYARDLVNTPASDMTPQHLAAVAREIASKKKSQVTVRVLDAAAAKKLNMGAFLAVAKGSDEAPQFIHLTYTPKRSGKLKKVFFVGKGVTFDSGGLHVKPWGYMENMKIDMAGAAAVLGLFSRIDELAPRCEVHGIIPAVENMPSGKAAKPGDVAMTLSGKTVEILNTDAEGRLILCDALGYAVREKADYIVDLATLTGACVVALGEEIAGMFGNTSAFTKMVMAASKEVGEPLWQLPLPGRYKELLKSKVADYRNTGDRWGGAIVAALFLQEFVEKTPWVHLDIAGPAWAERETQPSVPLGATGFGVRTLEALLATLR
ncbi:MAG: leucyl aminopeptidase [Patescibacteria group bacterium]